MKNKKSQNETTLSFIFKQLQRAPNRLKILWVHSRVSSSLTTPTRLKRLVFSSLFFIRKFVFILTFTSYSAHADSNT